MFGKKCCLCGENAEIGARVKLKTQEYICRKCWYNSGCSMVALEKMTPVEVNEAIRILNEGIEATKYFHPTKTVSDRMNNNYFHIDENRKEWYIPSRVLREVPEIHHFDEIIGYELLENNTSLTKGGVAQVIVGAALFGEAGAIVGASAAKRETINECSSLCVKIILNNIQDPEKIIEFVTLPVKTDSAAYKVWKKCALEIISILRVICNSNEKDEQPTKTSDNSTMDDDKVVNSIRKFKSLYDEGIITKEEFDAKKRQLLGV